MLHHGEIVGGVAVGANSKVQGLILILGYVCGVCMSSHVCKGFSGFIPTSNNIIFGLLTVKKKKLYICAYGAL